MDFAGATERTAERLLEGGQICVTDIIHLELQYRDSPQFTTLRDLVSHRSVQNGRPSIYKVIFFYEVRQYKGPFVH
jgi:hypothetical protein